MSDQLAIPGAAPALVPPAPHVDQVTAAYLERPGSPTHAVRELFDDAWEVALTAGERRRLVALRDAVLGVVGGVEEECEVAHRLMGGDEGEG